MKCVLLLLAMAGTANAQQSPMKQVCGATYDEAVITCEKALCETDADCPPGTQCFLAVTCPLPPTPKPTLAPKPPTPPYGSVSADRRCGTSFDNANEQCGGFCPGGVDEQCPTGQKCYQDVTCDTLTTKAEFRCGVDVATAAQMCGTPCPNGFPFLCPPGEFCFPKVTCLSAVLNVAAAGATPEPTTDAPPATELRCGTSLDDSCGDECPGGADAECDPGLFCFKTDKCTDQPNAAMRVAPLSAAVYAVSALVALALAAAQR
ncbi:hypothetical protein JKP88DRAFT_266393 [Tribonema minus]|uniref:Uncharacterized protein n=1 Tax=Tribonema minus TaxID=303371 RepID=A0A836CNT0_9STRA|nr:hypothetical protein JKP88DRAFT_266393 [Tribonema minus]